MAKRKLSLINRIFFLLNNVFAIALVISFFIPKLLPEKYGVFALLSLLTPVLILMNLFFVIYWILIGFKKQVIVSFLVLLLSLLFIPPVYKFYNNIDNDTTSSLSILTYNVRKFNLYNWIDDDDIHSKIGDLISSQNPDIVALQEFRNTKNFRIAYPYSYNPYVSKHAKSSLAIYSKYPIINKGSIKYDNYDIRTIFTDIVKNNDTLRIYNFHLESLGIIPDEDYFGHKDSEKLIKRLQKSFKIQQRQIDSLNAHVTGCKHKMILTGDLNNTAYSWAYKHIKNELQDSFLEAGKGFGTSYRFKKFPLRIDYIFVDSAIKITNHKNFKEKFSDHYPITVTLEF